MGELSGKVAFVSGSGRGLGRTAAELIAERGADIAIHDPAAFKSVVAIAAK